jgi:hypothetical protein
MSDPSRFFSWVSPREALQASGGSGDAGDSGVGGADGWRVLSLFVCIYSAPGALMPFAPTGGSAASNNAAGGSISGI